MPGMQHSRSIVEVDQHRDRTIVQDLVLPRARASQAMTWISQSLPRPPWPSTKPWARRKEHGRVLARRTSCRVDLRRDRAFGRRSPCRGATAPTLLQVPARFVGNAVLDRRIRNLDLRRLGARCQRGAELARSDISHDPTEARTCSNDAMGIGASLPVTCLISNTSTAQMPQPSNRLGSPSSLAIALRVARTVSASSCAGTSRPACRKAARRCCWNSTPRPCGETNSAS